MEDLISKKELLKATGISYGQLYRWKREKLIPEDWFHKQASATGQETFFPKAQILRRVARILELKDLYSLEDMAGLLSPEVINRSFNEEELELFEEIDVFVASLFMDVMECDIFSFRQIVIMMAITSIHKSLALKEEALKTLIQSIVKQFVHVSSMDYEVIIAQIQEQYYAIIFADGSNPILDERMIVVKHISLQELSNTMKTKYQSVFHFTFD